SEIEACSPAPASTATLAPRPMNFLTVSGVAATRVSPAASSFRTAMRMPGRSGREQKNDEGGHEHRDDRPYLEQAEEARIGFLCCFDILFGRHWLFPLYCSLRARRTRGSILDSRRS